MDSSYITVSKRYYDAMNKICAGICRTLCVLQKKPIEPHMIFSFSCDDSERGDSDNIPDDVKSPENG